MMSEATTAYYTAGYHLDWIASSLQEADNKSTCKQYIDFLELPPAKGKGKPMPQSLEGQIIEVQAAELMHARKIILDLATWIWRFSIYVYSVTMPELMAY